MKIKEKEAENPKVLFKARSNYAANLLQLTVLDCFS